MKLALSEGGDARAAASAAPAPAALAGASEPVHGGGSVTTDGGDAARMRKYYEDRIASLSAKLQFADSKAVTFYDEARNVAMRYELLRHSQAKQDDKYKDVNETISGLKADLETTKRSYEEQLAAMSEHVMIMNDQLQEKNADISSLKAEAKQGA